MPTWRRWAALAVLVLPVLLISIDMTVLGFAVPALSEALEPSGTQLLWIIDVYSFLLAGLLVLMGNLGDRIGRRRLLMIGAGLFGAASLVAAFSTTAEMLLLARALLGVGGATLMPSTLSLIRSVFDDPAERRTAIAVWAAAFSGGAAIGPILGGWLLEHFWWGSVFLINVPVMIALVVGALVFLPESRNPRPGPFDLLSALMSIIGMLTLVYGLKTFGKGELDAPGVGASVVGVVLLWLFVRRQLRLDEPLLDVRLFSRRVFAVSVSVNLLTMVAFLPIMFFVPQYLQLVLGMTPLAAGLWMVPMALATVVGAILSPRVARRVPVHRVIGTGMTLAAVGLAVGALLTPAGEIWAFVVLSLLAGGGIGLVETLTNDAIIASAPVEKVGGAAAVSETAYEFGAAMGLAVFGTLGMAIYREQLLRTAPAGLSESALTSASQTLGGAEHVADALPTSLGEQLHTAAGAAFTTGMSWVHAVSSVILLVVGVGAWLMLRREPAELATDPSAPAASAPEPAGAGR
ncbi:MFS transporter [Ornithinimicrobium panacihumi]|uniref:MFS transporter n=1 Tax=Ornithinimicrobium panacihumi TaxID=2008449 RepID=UPI003F8A6FED